MKARKQKYFKLSDVKGKKDTGSSSSSSISKSKGNYKISNSKLSSNLVFNSIFENPKKKIPIEIEDKLLDSFTEYTESLSNDEDLKLNELKKFFQDYLKINDKLINFIKLNDYLLIGTNNIVDFEKYLYFGSILLILNNNLIIIDHYWNLLINGLKLNDDNSYLKEDYYKITINCQDLKKIFDSIDDKSGDDNSESTQNNNKKSVTSMEMLIKMINVVTDGLKPEINYYQFGILLGKLGELNYM
ncbi:hypothetical protein B5S28_g2915 [[Candida] boidinii]|nr:hypothetical protein B5S28_g2915 [[Candida] boidinii]OWB61257.1 hypothetical protein B5S29_g2145 [[Candida] boidinii]OWB75278.1 hypothetical protein B5S31_g5155 [[Candida] boidinii]OWB78379.1 hypothetical protein B5S32_g2572 [[Candida] boidinii]